ncbi:MAG: hypothetical protein ACREQA_21150 [Candidatus Binatia bacterium]
MDDELFPVIRALTDRYPLRDADAIHLSSALWLGHALREIVTFVTADSRLLEAARDQRLKVINPEIE